MDSLTDMNNKVTNSCLCLEFLGDYEIRNVEMKSGSEWSGEAIKRLLIDNEEYEMKVSMKEGKKDGIGMIVRKNGVLFMKLMFVNDECEGEVAKMNEYGNIVLRGRVSGGKEVGIWIEYDDEGNEIWRGLYRNGKRYSILKEQSGMKGFYRELNEDGEVLSVSEYDDNWKKNGRCFEVESGYFRECVYENGVKKRVIREFIGKTMRLFDDNGKKVYEGVWFGSMVNGFVIHPETKRMKGFYRELNEDGKVLSVSEYDESGLLKNGRCFKVESGCFRECVYKNGVMMRVLREWKGEVMIEYDDNGMRVYEGGFEGDMMKGFVREGKGKEYGNDGKSALYVGGWKNGLRDGDGSELNENEEVVRKGRWIKGVYIGNIKQLEDGYENGLSVFDSDCLKGYERVEIGNGCFKNVNRFVIDGLNELKSVIIGGRCFKLDYQSISGSKCVIMNCDQLSDIHIGWSSFNYYESFECKNLPSLISIQLDVLAFLNCQTIVFESMNDW